MTKIGKMTNSGKVAQGQREALLPLLLKGLDVGLQTPAGLASWLAAHGTSEAECEAGLQLLQEYGCAVNIGEVWKATLTPAYIRAHKPAQLMNSEEVALKRHARTLANGMLKQLEEVLPVDELGG